MAKMALEAGRVATEKMLDYYRRMGIEVTPEMTLAPEKPATVPPRVTPEERVIAQPRAAETKVRLRDCGSGPRLQ